MNGQDVIGPDSGGRTAFVLRREYERMLAKVNALCKMKFSGLAVGSTTWDSTGVSVVLNGTSNDEDTGDFSYTITGDVITVRRGSIWLDSVLFVLPETKLTIYDASPCIAVQIHRVSKTIELVQAHDDSEFRDGIGSDDTYFRLPICTMTYTAGVVSNVRRLCAGRAYVAFSPA